MQFLRGLSLVRVAMERYFEIWDPPFPPFTPASLLLSQRTCAHSDPISSPTSRSQSSPQGALHTMTNPLVDPSACSGFSRRTFFRFAAGASALATIPILTEAHLAMAQRPHFADPTKGIHIDANENPLGPSEAARQAMIDKIGR